MLSLLTIAFLTLVGQAMMSGLADEQSNGVKVLTSVDNQRKLCENIASSAAAVQLSRNTDERFKALSQLYRDLSDWRKAKETLDGRKESFDLPAADDAAVHQIYLELKPHYSAILEAGEIFLKRNSTAENRTASLREILAQEASLLGGFDSLSRHFRQTSSARLTRLRVMDLSVGFLILALLGMEFAFVYRPKVIALHDASRALSSMNDHLVAKNGELEAQRAKMEEQHAQLLEQQAELTASNEQLTEQSSQLEELNSNLDRTHELYASAARKMEELFQGIPVACFTFDKDGRIEDWNRSCEALFGLNSYEVLGQVLGDVLKGAMPEDQVVEVVRSPFTGRTVDGLIWQVRCPEGDLRWVMSCAFPLLNQDRDPIAGVCTNVDITDRTLYAAQLEESMVQLNEYSLELEMQRSELEDANARLEALATTDGLTGLRNHRSFQERLEHDFIQATHDQTDLTLILMDVDHFKKFNDTYGHPEGDKVLKAVAQVLLSHGAEPNTAARYGGEEFVVVVPGMAPEKAALLAEKIRMEIQDSCPTGVEVTASLGMASWFPGMRSRAELIAQADKALYQSKSSGRNRVTHASSLWVDEIADAA